MDLKETEKQKTKMARIPCKIQACHFDLEIPTSKEGS